MIVHWVVLADASRARICRSDELITNLEEVDDMVHPQSRMHAGELLSDDRGRMRNMAGVGTAMDAHTDPADVEQGRFAAELARALLHGLEQGRYERLVIAAPPRFLGMLRGELSPRVQKAVVGEIHHDYVHTPLHQVGALIAAQLQKA